MHSLCSTASPSWFFYIAVNDGWPSLKWVGHRGPVYQGQGGGWDWVELRTADSTHTRTHTCTAAVLKWSPGYSACPLSHSFCSCPLLFYFPTSLQFLNFIIVSSALIIRDFNIVAIIINIFDKGQYVSPSLHHPMFTSLFSYARPTAAPLLIFDFKSTAWFNWGA